MPATGTGTARPDALRAALTKFSAGEKGDGVQARQEALFAPKEASASQGSGARAVPMQVLNLGMPRTGTMSMQRALDLLGYRCYHSSAFFSRIGDCALWDAALDAKFFAKGAEYGRADWDRLLGEYSAVSADPPPVAFAEDLVRAYPEAKVVLVERDREAWFRSFSGTVTAGVWSPLMHRIADWDPWFVGPMRDTHMRWARGWFRATSREHMDSISRQMYDDHYALVRRVTPKHRLLEYRLGDGWEPLCRFLGRDVPACDFPNVNDSDAVWEQMAIIAQRGTRNAAWKLAQLGAVGLAVSAAAWCVWSMV